MVTILSEYRLKTKTDIPILFLNKKPNFHNYESMIPGYDKNKTQNKGSQQKIVKEAQFFRIKAKDITKVISHGHPKEEFK